VKQLMQMPGSKYLLDTNIVIEVLSGNIQIAETVKGLIGFSLWTTVLGELYVGIYRVANKIKHERKLLDFLSHCEIIPPDITTSKKFGAISALLYKKGKPIPSNDIWIAATAMQHGLILATRDNHFNEVEGLKTERW